MKLELENKLYERFPKFFGQKDLPMTQTCMCWGIDTDDGWFNLIWETCEKLEVIDPELEFVQIKEKLGGLRLYVNTTVEAAFDVIDEAEEQSYKICEECGSQENVTQTEGWIYTRCTECIKEIIK